MMRFAMLLGVFTFLSFCFFPISSCIYTHTADNISTFCLVVSLCVLFETPGLSTPGASARGRQRGYRRGRWPSESAGGRDIQQASIQPLPAVGQAG